MHWPTRTSWFDFKFDANGKGYTPFLSEFIGGLQLSFWAAVPCDSFRFFIEKLKVDKMKCMDDGRTALALASYNGHRHVTRYLKSVGLRDSKLEVNYHIFVELFLTQTKETPLVAPCSARSLCSGLLNPCLLSEILYFLDCEIAPLVISVCNSTWIWFLNRTGSYILDFPALLKLGGGFECEYGFAYII